MKDESVHTATALAGAGLFVVGMIYIAHQVSPEAAAVLAVLTGVILFLVGTVRLTGGGD